MFFQFTYIFINMRKIFLFLVILLLISFVGYSQEIFDQEWYDKLNSPLEFVIYENFSKKLHSIRVYRGEETEYLLTIKDYYGNSIYNKIIARYEEIDLSFLSCGHYIIEINNSKATRLQIIEIK